MAVEGEGSFSVQVPSSPAPAPVAEGGASGASDFSSFVPAEYKEAAWLEPIAKSEKPFDTMFKNYANAQTLIGKKSEASVIPTAESTPEQWAAFHKALGVPEKPEGYNYTAPDLAAESESVRTVISQLSADQTLLNGIRELAHKEGITEKQFNSLVAKYDAHTLEQVKSIVANNETARATFVEQQSAKVKEIFGDKHEGMHGIAKDIALKVLPESVRNTKDPEIALLAALNYIHEQGFAGDSIVRPSAAPTETAGDIRGEIMSVRKEMKELKGGFQSSEHAALKAKLDQLYVRESELKSGAK